MQLQANHQIRISERRRLTSQHPPATTRKDEARTPARGNRRSPQRHATTRHPTPGDKTGEHTKESGNSYTRRIEGRRPRESCLDNR
jgi:hypothetical protein